MKDEFIVPDCLKALIINLKETVSCGNLTEELIQQAISSLAASNHKTYDFNKFPKLENTSSFKGDVGPTPASLAEALLWKLGKWPTYKTFVENYNDKNLKVSAKGGVVFSASTTQCSFLP